MRPNYQKYRFSWQEYLVTGVIGVAIWCALDYLFYRSFVLLWFSGIWLIGFYIWVKKQKMKKRKKDLHYHFKDVLIAMQTAVQAGYAVESAVREAAENIGHGVLDAARDPKGSVLGAARAAQTGDYSLMIGWLIALFIAVGGMFIWIRMFVRRRRNRG